MTRSAAESLLRMGVEPPQPPGQPPAPQQPPAYVVPLAQAEVQPLPGIFQAAYQLTEAEFLYVRHPSVFWTTVGSALFTFGVAYALDTAYDLVKAEVSITSGDYLPAMIIIVLGLVCFGLSGILSKERAAVMKRIKQFFKDNPAEPEVRHGRR